MSTPTPQTQRLNHFVINGSDGLAYRLAKQLAERYSAEVVVVMTTAQRDNPLEAPRDFSDLQETEGVEVRVVARIDEQTMQEAGLATAAGLALVDQDDVGNIHLALLAHEMAPRVRLVIRMYNTDLGHSIQSLIEGCKVLSDSEIAAPALIATALGEIAAAPVAVGQRTLVVAQRENVLERDIVCGLADTTSNPDDPLVLPGDERTADLVLAEQRSHELETTLRVGTTKPSRAPWFSIVGAFLQAAVSRKTRIALTIVFGLILAAGAALSLTLGLGLWDGTYLTAVTVLGGLQQEVDYAGWQRGLQLLLGTAGLAFIPLVTALVVEGMVKARLAVQEARLRYPHSDHIVVVGLGGVGTRVIRLLHQRELKVVAVTDDPQARGVAAARELGIPLLIADPIRVSTLRQAGVERCRALMAIAKSDVSNLETALHGRLLKDTLRVVLRVFDGDLAARIRRRLNIRYSRSVSYLAAPVFAEALMGREVIGTIAVGRRLLLVAEVFVTPGSPLDGALVGAIDDPGALRVVAITEFGEPRPMWHPASRRIVQGRERLTVVATRQGLTSLIERCAEA